jgi:hypothetical protein
MSSYPIPSEHGLVDVALDRAQGKPLQSLQVYQTEEMLNLDLRFEDGLEIELIFRVGFQASAKLLEYRNGDAHVLKRMKLRRRG